jgi:hypothetical protein
MDNHVEKGCVHLQMAVVFDQAEFPEFVHKIVDPRARGPDPGSQDFLADLGDHRLQLPILAEVREEKKKPRKPFFA